MSNKYVAQNIQAAIQQATVVIPNAIAGQNFTYADYRKQRMILNTYIISAVFGAEIIPAQDGTFKTKLNKKLANKTETLEMVNIMDTFVNTVEKPYLAAVKAAVEASDDMETLVDPAATAYVPQFDKIKVKEVKSYLAGGKGATSYPMIGMFFDGHQVLEMSALAEQVRKIIDRNNAIIIGGIILTAAAAVGTGAYAYGKYKKNKAVSGETADDYINDDDVEVIDPDEAEDIPVVSVDE